MGREYPSVNFGPWPKGVNTRLSEFELKTADGVEFLRDALNIDIDNTGRLRRRRGYAPIFSGDATHSLFAAKNHFLFVDDDTLYYGLPPNHSALLSGLPTLTPMGYAEVNGEVRMSNGIITKRLTAAGVLTPWGVDTPPGAPAIAAIGFGGLDAGRYQVAVVFVAPDGEESGASIVVDVTVAIGGGIQLTSIPQPTDGYTSAIRVYVTKVNGERFYHLVDLSVGTTTLNIGASSALGRELTTLFLQPFPACPLLEYYNGRMYGAIGPYVFYSEPLRYGLFRPAMNFILYSADVTVLKAVEDGMYVCADQTYWHGGAGAKQFSQRTLLPYGAVPGTGVKHENGRQVAWFSEKGYVVGGNGGELRLAQDTNVAVSKYEHGAVLYREDRGVRQLASALRGATQSQFVASDYAEAELVRSATP
jgi:hypothetical protein